MDNHVLKLKCNFIINYENSMYEGTENRTDSVIDDHVLKRKSKVTLN